MNGPLEIYANSLAGKSGVNGDKFYHAREKVFAVADGASGAYDKVAAGDLCIRAIAEVDLAPAGLDSREYIRQCFALANDKLIDKSRNDGQLSFGTLSMAVIEGETLTVGAVGDTPAFLIQGNRLKRAVKPRKSYHKLVELGLLPQVEIERAIALLPDVLWSAFEVFLPMIVIDIAMEQYTVSSGDTLIICTDGITDWIKDEEFIKEFRGKNAIADSCEILFQLTEERCPPSKRDDATILAVRF